MKKRKGLKQDDYDGDDDALWRKGYGSKIKG